MPLYEGCFRKSENIFFSPTWLHCTTAPKKFIKKIGKKRNFYSSSESTSSHSK